MTQARMLLSKLSTQMDIQPAREVCSHSREALSHTQVALSHTPVALSHTPVAWSHTPVALSHTPVALSHTPVAFEPHPCGSEPLPCGFKPLPGSSKTKAGASQSGIPRFQGSPRLDLAGYRRELSASYERTEEVMIGVAVTTALRSGNIERAVFAVTRL
jgi:hypothetical protein